MFIQESIVLSILNSKTITDFDRERLASALDSAIKQKKFVAERRKKVTEEIWNAIYLFLKDKMNGVPTCVFDLTNAFNREYNGDVSPQSIGSFLSRMAFKNRSNSDGSIDECMDTPFPNFRTKVVEGRRYYWVGGIVSREEILRHNPPKFARSIKNWGKSYF